MFNLFILVFLVLVVCFGFVLLFGAPYLPIHKKQMEVCLDELNLKKGQLLLELGCGDGRVLIAAAQRGINSIGYELNPILVIIAWLRTRRYKHRVRIVWGDYWSIDWPKADAIFGFILAKYMKKLDNKIIQYPYRPLKLASYAFQVPGKATWKIKDGLFFYKYQ